MTKPSHPQSKRWDLHSQLPDWLCRGLRTSSIKETAIPLFYKDSPQQLIQAIEFYELSAGTSSYPLTAVDIATNTYLRLSYQKPNGRSGTLGTSLVGTISFRTDDNVLHFIPKISQARLEIDNACRPEVTLKGNFGDMAEITCLRKYVAPTISNTTCEVSVTLEALTDIKLAPHSLGNDAFRFCTLSSMYTPGRYDSNSIEYLDPQSELKKIKLEDMRKRGAYLFKRSAEVSSSIALTKDHLSCGRIGAPGSHDSPSIYLSINQDKYKIGAQAYLAPSLDINADSLSLWLEWQDAPRVIERGSKISISYAVRASAPGVTE